MLSPITGGGRRRNGYAAVLFLLEEIHGCLAIIHFPDAMVLSRIKEYAFGGGGFSRVDVGHDPYISYQ